MGSCSLSKRGSWCFIAAGPRGEGVGAVLDSTWPEQKSWGIVTECISDRQASCFHCKFQKHRLITVIFLHCLEEKLHSLPVKLYISKYGLSCTSYMVSLRLVSLTLYLQCFLLIYALVFVLFCKCKYFLRYLKSHIPVFCKI